LEKANKDFPNLDFNYELPHKWPNNEYREKNEELERQMVELIAWRSLWFGQKAKNSLKI